MRPADSLPKIRCLPQVPNRSGLLCFGIGGKGLLLSRRLLRFSVFVAVLPAAVASDADDAGRFFAGLTGAPGSLFARLEASPAWKEHRRRLDEAFRKAETGLMSGLRDFQRQELEGTRMARSTVFYPFGGPDALTATLCFPHSPAYVIVGLEPAGTLPSAGQASKRDLALYLDEVRETLSSVLGRSFFITRQMDHQFRGQVTDGLLLPILQLLARTNHTIDGFRYVRINDDGQLIEREAAYQPPPGKFGNKGVEIQFREDSSPSTQKLYYFAVNLADDRLRENKAFLKYLSRFQSVTTLLKAASYALHRPDFSTIRDFMLSNSEAILQDDSGIPYRCFQPGLWNVGLYGGYDHPYGSFRGLAQADLRKAYLTSRPKPLSFAIGYGFARIPSNLLLARRVMLGTAVSKPEAAH
jgi:hypothetical protein